MSFTANLWLFALAVTLHMLEEVIWLPDWSRDAGRWHAPVGRRAFAAAAVVFLLCIYLITYIAWRGSPVVRVETAVYLICSLALVMLLNILMPHLLAAIDQRRYAPGLASAILFILPAASLLLWRFFSNFPTNWLNFILALILVGLTAVYGWPVLFKTFDRQRNDEG